MIKPNCQKDIYRTVKPIDSNKNTLNVLIFPHPSFWVHPAYKVSSLSMIIKKSCLSIILLHIPLLRTRVRSQGSQSPAQVHYGSFIKAGVKIHSKDEISSILKFFQLWMAFMKMTIKITFTLTFILIVLFVLFFLLFFLFFYIITRKEKREREQKSSATISFHAAIFMTCKSVIKEVT